MTDLFVEILNRDPRHRPHTATSLRDRLQQLKATLADRQPGFSLA
jgi:type VI protein secretion system component VasK